jgi:hypothetical protein
MPIQCTMLVVERSVTMPPFYCLNEMRFGPFHHTLIVVEGNYDNATFFIIT